MATYLPNVTDVFPDPATYTPDFSFLDQMLKRRASMYEQGYAQIAGRYNYLNRELTHDQNRQARDKFLSRAQQNLKNLSAMDLSIPQNVQAAGAVFEPFYKNRTALADMAFTEHIKQQNAIADSFMQKDGGKEYSDYNRRYVNMQQEEFRNDSAESVFNYLGNKRYYTPYKDYTKKFMEAYEKFKPSEVDIQYVDGQYIRGKKDASVHAAEFKAFLEGVLSPEEKRQIEIEGIVKYGASPQSLLSYYDGNIKEEMRGIDGNIKRLTDAAPLAKTKEQKQQIDAQIKYFTDKKNSLNESYQKLASMDPQTIKSIKDKAAAELYYTEVVNRFANAAEREVKKETVEANSIWATIYSQQQQNYRQANQQAFELKKMERQAELDVLTGKNKGSGSGSGSANEALTGSSILLKSSKALTYGAKDIEEGILSARSAMDEQDKRLASHLIVTGQKSDPGTVKTFISKMAKISNNTEPIVDPKSKKIIGLRYRDTKKPVEATVMADIEAYNKWANGVAPHEMKLRTLENSKKQLEEEVRTKGGKEYAVIDEKIKKILGGKNLDITVGGKTMRISPKEIADGIASGSITTQIVGAQSMGTPGGSVYIPGEEYITINGKSINLNGKGMKLLKDVVQEIRTINNSKEAKKLNTIRAGVYTSNMVTNNSLALFDKDSDFFKDRKGEAEQIIGKEVEIRGGDLVNGALAVSLKEKDKSTKNDVIKAIAGRADVVYDETNDLFLIKGLANMRILDNYSSMQRTIYQAASSPVKGKQVSAGVYSLESPPFKIGDLPYDFQWKRVGREYAGTDGTKIMDYEYYLFDGNNPTRPLFSGFSDPLQLIEVIGKLGNAPDAAISRIESLK